MRKLVLGIETTCDETAIAVVVDGKKILSNVIASQADLHAKYGGVFPEQASRRHLEMMLPVCKQALQEANVTFSDIDLIAVANGPGLIGALLVGIHFAKGLSFGLQKPLVAVNHVEAHLYSAWMSHTTEIPLPALGIVLSGGHTALLHIHNIHEYSLIGQTQDDACGEAFDKVATLLGLPYPGGPKIEALAREGNPLRFPLKGGKIKNNPFDFSFSGLKTSVLYLVKGQNHTKHDPLIITEEDKKDVAASFQQAVFTDIISKAKNAFKTFPFKSIIIGGGVSQNLALRRFFDISFSEIPIFWPNKDLTLDNGAMIAGLGNYIYSTKGIPDINSIVARPRIPFL